MTKWGEDNLEKRRWEIRGFRRDGTEGVYIAIKISRVTAQRLIHDNPHLALVDTQSGMILEGYAFQDLRRMQK